MTLRIVADENMPYAAEAFGTLGDVRLVHGRKITAETVANADLLFVRSITKVNAALLDGSPVRFVGTATAGVDHVDEEYLRKAGIGFSAAPGCNANSVGEYMVAAWLTLAARKGFDLRDRRLGVIGVGNVGTRVEAKASALGMELVLNDPPKERESGDHARYSPIEAVYDCDIVTMHTPLTYPDQDPDPTHHMADAAFFASLKPGAIFCNAGRGEVVDESALHAAIDAGRLSAVVLDVWENEPRIDPSLLEKVDIGSQHIAGYSHDGKFNGTNMVYEAACEHLGLEKIWQGRAAMPSPEVPELAIDAAGRADEALLLEAVTRLCPIARDDADLRKTIDMSAEERGGEFDRLRKQYPYRREFHNTRLTLPNASEELRAAAAGLGFDLAP